MNWLAASLYALGLVGALASIRRDPEGRYVPSGLREWAVVIGWPITVSAAIGLGIFTSVRRGWRP